MEREGDQTSSRILKILLIALPTPSPHTLPRPFLRVGVGWGWGLKKYKTWIHPAVVSASKFEWIVESLFNS